MAEPTHYVFLVPGFFGFSNLGDFYYFGHLVQEVERLFAARELPVRVVRVATHPTASLRHRALCLHRAVVEAEAQPQDVLHFVGHSAGGLDVRLLLAPGTDLGPDVDVEAYAGQVRSAVTVSTPHRGTPLASFFAELSGRRFLRLLSLMTVFGLRFGHLPLSVGLKVSSLVTNLDKVGFKPSMVDQLYKELLADFSPERRQEVQAFFTDVTGDLSLIAQVGPEAMDVFNVAVKDRPGVACGCVLTCARPPNLKGRIDGGLGAWAQTTQTIYRVLHRRVSDHPPQLLPPVGAAYAPKLLECYQRLPNGQDHDAIVPTRSQLWGQLIDAVYGDHHDVIGHFDAPNHDPPHMDWLSTGSRFTRARFDETWRRVVDFLIDGPGDRLALPAHVEG